MARSIAGSAGTEPEQVAIHPADAPVVVAADQISAAPGTDPAGLLVVPQASITIRDGAVYVEVDGKVGRLSPADVARLGGLASAAPTIGD